MERIVLTVILSLCLCAAAVAQGGGVIPQATPSVRAAKITGRVVDEEGKPMLAVTVAASRASVPGKPVRGVVTDSAGRFSLQLPGGEYSLKTVFLGYATRTFDVDTGQGDASLGDVVMAVSAVAIEDVVVRPLVELQPSSIVYNITSDPERAGSNMMQILKKVPLISTAFDGSIEVDNERSSYIVLRNGRPDPMFNNSGVPLHDVLTRLSAMGFSKVTVMLDPPPKWGDYKYAIDIEVDRLNRVFGTVGNGSLTYNAQEGQLDSGPGLTGSADRVRFSGNTSYMNIYSPSTQSVMTQSYTASNTSLTRSEETRTRGWGPAGQVQASYDLSKRQFIAVSFSAARRESRVEQHSYASSVAGGAQPVVTASLFGRQTLSIPLTASVSYQLDFSKPARSLVVSYALGDTGTESGETLVSEEGSGEGTYGTETSGHVSDRSHVASAYYSDKIGNSLTMNFKINYLHGDYNESSEGWTLTGEKATPYPGSYRSLRRSMRRVDGRLFVSWNLSKRVTLRPLVNIDYLAPGSATVATYGMAPAQNVDQQGFANSATLHASILFPKTKRPEGSDGKAVPGNRMFVFYSLTSRRPATTQLSNHADERNPDYIATGNPSLGNETYHSLAVSLAAGTVSRTGMMVMCSDNRIMKYWFTDQQQRTVETWINGGRYRSVSLSQSLNYILGPKIDLKISASGIYVNETAAQDDDSQSLQVISSAYCSYRLLPNITANATLLYSDTWGRGYAGMGNDYPVQLSLGLYGKANLGKTCTADIGLYLNNAFVWRSGYTQFINSPEFTLDRSSRMNYVPVTVRINLTFGRFNVKPPRTAKSSGTIEGFSTGAPPEN